MDGEVTSLISEEVFETGAEIEGLFEIGETPELTSEVEAK
jgi:hypothetical protein